MGIDIIFKIAAIGILTIVIGQILTHSGRSDIATLASLSGLVIVLVMVLSMISELFDTVKQLFGL